MKLTKIFISVNKDVKEDDILIKNNEIGIIVNEEENISTIFFIISGKIITLSKNDFDYFDSQKTGDSFNKKICNVCHRLLPTTQFSKNQNGKGDRTVRRSSCDECRKVIDGVKVPLSEKRKWKALKPEYKPFQCPICLKTTIPGLTSKIVLDHDHSTGKVRGWIYDSCNTGIGRFKDDIALLEKAITYLRTS